MKAREFTVFGLTTQAAKLKGVSNQYLLSSSEDDFNFAIQPSTLKHTSGFIFLSSSGLNTFIKFMTHRLKDFKTMSAFHEYRPALLSIADTKLSDEKFLLDDLFKDAFISNNGGWHFLNKDQLLAVLSKPMEDRVDRAIGVQLLKGIDALRILRGNFETILVPLSCLKPSTLDIKLNYKDIEVMQFGHYIRFGEYEASMSGLLYEIDADYRARDRKNRLEHEVSFGACLRRLRIQKRMKQTEFKSAAEKTIRRIEAGEETKETTKKAILHELKLTEDELLSY